MKGGKTHKYRPFRSTLAGSLGTTFLAMHPSCCLQEKPPRWIIYDHIVYTSQPFMHQICAIEYEWIEPLLPLLKGADVSRLSGREVTADTEAERQEQPDPEVEASSTATANVSTKGSSKKAKASKSKSSAAKKNQHLDRRATSNTISSARERFLQRQAKKKQKKEKKKR